MSSGLRMNAAEVGVEVEPSSINSEHETETELQNENEQKQVQQHEEQEVQQQHDEVVRAETQVQTASPDESPSSLHQPIEETLLAPFPVHHTITPSSTSPTNSDNAPLATPLDARSRQQEDEQDERHQEQKPISHPDSNGTSEDEKSDEDEGPMQNTERDVLHQQEEEENNDDANDDDGVSHQISIPDEYDVSDTAISDLERLHIGPSSDAHWFTPNRSAFYQRRDRNEGMNATSSLDPFNPHAVPSIGSLHALSQTSALESDLLSPSSSPSSPPPFPSASSTRSARHAFMQQWKRKQELEMGLPPGTIDAMEHYAKQSKSNKSKKKHAADVVGTSPFDVPAWPNVQRSPEQSHVVFHGLPHDKRFGPDFHFFPSDSAASSSSSRAHAASSDPTAALFSLHPLSTPDIQRKARSWSRQSSWTRTQWNREGMRMEDGKDRNALGTSTQVIADMWKTVQPARHSETITTSAQSRLHRHMLPTGNVLLNAMPPSHSPAAARSASISAASRIPPRFHPNVSRERRAMSQQDWDVRTAVGSFATQRRRRAEVLGRHHTLTEHHAPEIVNPYDPLSREKIIAKSAQTQRNASGLWCNMSKGQRAKRIITERERMVWEDVNVIGAVRPSSYRFIPKVVNNRRFVPPGAHHHPPLSDRDLATLTAGLPHDIASLPLSTLLPLLAASSSSSTSVSAFSASLLPALPPWAHSSAPDASSAWRQHQAFVKRERHAMQQEDINAINGQRFEKALGEFTQMREGKTKAGRERRAMMREDINVISGEGSIRSAAIGSTHLGKISLASLRGRRGLQPASAGRADDPFNLRRNRPSYVPGKNYTHTWNAMTGKKNKHDEIERAKHGGMRYFKRRRPSMLHGPHLLHHSMPNSSLILDLSIDSESMPLVHGQPYPKRRRTRYRYVDALAWATITGAVLPPLGPDGSPLSPSPSPSLTATVLSPLSNPESSPQPLLRRRADGRLAKSYRARSATLKKATAADASSAATINWPTKHTLLPRYHEQDTLVFDRFLPFASSSMPHSTLPSSGISLPSHVVAASMDAAPFTFDDSKPYIFDRVEPFVGPSIDLVGYRPRFGHLDADMRSFPFHSEELYPDLNQIFKALTTKERKDAVRKARRKMKRREAFQHPPSSSHSVRRHSLPSMRRAVEDRMAAESRFEATRTIVAPWDERLGGRSGSEMMKRRRENEMMAMSSASVGQQTWMHNPAAATGLLYTQQSTSTTGPFSIPASFLSFSTITPFGASPTSFATSPSSSLAFPSTTFPTTSSSSSFQPPAAADMKSSSPSLTSDDQSSKLTAALANNPFRSPEQQEQLATFIRNETERQAAERGQKQKAKEQRKLERQRKQEEQRRLQRSDSFDTATVTAESTNRFRSASPLRSSSLSPFSPSRTTRRDDGRGRTRYRSDVFGRLSPNDGPDERALESYLQWEARHGLSPSGARRRWQGQATTNATSAAYRLQGDETSDADSSEDDEEDRMGEQKWQHTHRSRSSSPSRKRKTVPLSGTGHYGSQSPRFEMGVAGDELPSQVRIEPFACEDDDDPFRVHDLPQSFSASAPAPRVSAWQRHAARSRSRSRSRSISRERVQGRTRRRSRERQPIKPLFNANTPHRSGVFVTRSASPVHRERDRSLSPFSYHASRQEQLEAERHRYTIEQRPMWRSVSPSSGRAAYPTSSTFERRQYMDYSVTSPNRSRGVSESERTRASFVPFSSRPLATYSDVNSYPSSSAHRDSLSPSKRRMRPEFEWASKYRIDPTRDFDLSQHDAFERTGRVGPWQRQVDAEVEDAEFRRRWKESKEWDEFQACRSMQRTRGTLSKALDEVEQERYEAWLQHQEQQRELGHTTSRSPFPDYASAAVAPPVAASTLPNTTTTTSSPSSHATYGGVNVNIHHSGPWSHEHTPTPPHLQHHPSDQGTGHSSSDKQPTMSMLALARSSSASSPASRRIQQVNEEKYPTTDRIMPIPHTHSQETSDEDESEDDVDEHTNEMQRVSAVASSRSKTASIGSHHTSSSTSATSHSSRSASTHSTKSHRSSTSTSPSTSPSTSSRTAASSVHSIKQTMSGRSRDGTAAASALSSKRASVLTTPRSHVSTPIRSSHPSSRVASRPRSQLPSQHSSRAPSQLASRARSPIPPEVPSSSSSTPRPGVVTSSSSQRGARPSSSAGDIASACSGSSLSKPASHSALPSNPIVPPLPLSSIPVAAASDNMEEKEAIERVGDLPLAHEPHDVILSSHEVTLQDYAGDAEIGSERSSNAGVDPLAESAIVRQFIQQHAERESIQHHEGTTNATASVPASSRSSSHVAHDSISVFGVIEDLATEELEPPTRPKPVLTSDIQPPAKTYVTRSAASSSRTNRTKTPQKSMSKSTSSKATPAASGRSARSVNVVRSHRSNS